MVFIIISCHGPRLAIRPHLVSAEGDCLGGPSRQALAS